MTTTLPRLAHALVSEVMFIRPRRPDDHREFARLLPQCTPLFVYADADSRDWVRWSVPRDVAERTFGTHIKCQCCDATHPAPGEHSFAFDTALDEVDWYLEGRP